MCQKVGFIRPVKWLLELIWFYEKFIKFCEETIAVMQTVFQTVQTSNF